MRARILSLIAIGAAVVIALVYASNHGFPERRITTDGITAIRAVGFANLVSVHSAPSTTLRIGGRTFHDLRGAFPYFIRAGRIVAFVTESTSHKGVLVVHDREALSFVEIDLGELPLGYGFGDEGAHWEKFGILALPKVEIISEGRGQARYEVDLAKRTISRF